MAVNQNHTVDRRGAAIPSGESLLKKSSDVDLSFPQPPPGSNLFNGTKRGTLFLTSYRVIFVASRSDNDPMLSFMMPFHLMTNCTVEQPVFGANYIKGTVQAAPEGGWEGSTPFKIVFRKGGAIDFAQLMAKAAAAAAQGAPLRVASFWMTPLGIYVIAGERGMYAPQACQVAHGAPPAGYGPPPAGYGPPPVGYGAPPPRYDVLPPGYGSPPPLYIATPMGYGVPLPGYGAPPVSYGAPIVEYAVLPPTYGTTPMGSGSPPPRSEAPPTGYGTPPSGYGSVPPRSEAPPTGYGTPPSGYGSVPPGSRALPTAHDTPPAGSEARPPISAAAQTPGYQASFPSTSNSPAYSPPSKM